MQYEKPWLPIDAQIEKLRARGVVVDDDALAADVLREVGYYRLTGYLHPFRESSPVVDHTGRARLVVLDQYRSGTRLEHAVDLLEFDRCLRSLVIEGVDRIEVALRAQVGHVFGRRSPFAHEDPASFTPAFTAPDDRSTTGSRHGDWLERVRARQDASDEAFVVHFRTVYDDRMPIWALTEILELGHLARLFSGAQNDLATEIARAFGVPTKRLLVSWLASVNYVRNVAAHHARLFNRKLVNAPRRPRGDDVPLLAHLSATDAPKSFGVYSILAVMAYLLRSVPSDVDWAERVAALLARFPENPHVDLRSMGALPTWLACLLWTPGRVSGDSAGRGSGRR
ncbi:Abi family protein [Curtobacterium sp. MCPF17_050]|uniref:Abi family protein n=1 Tax=Curtobacterium sp. MCPF17_050 TaxID=2175664 RepID=UPI000D93C520|nr:Abi family protein [Curtobacterium sp. MCPF17_050]WIB15413.1 Abi family protein [Curtobacterium sp. MCPF17_050]